MSSRRTFLTQVAAATLSKAAQPSASRAAAGDSRITRSTGTCRIPHTDLVVSRIAYGCGSLVNWDNTAADNGDMRKAASAIHTAYDNGITLFDHADVYSKGKAETVFGVVMKQSPGLREKIVIQSKCGQCLPQGWKPGDAIQVNLTREHIVSSVEGSLRRLDTDRLDILLLHIASALVDPEEVALAFEDLQRRGKVRYFGVSNYNASQLMLLAKTVRQPLVINQIHLSLAHPYPIADGMEFALQIGKSLDGDGTYVGIAGAGTLNYCRANEIQIQAWAPLRGVLNPPVNASAERRQTSQLLTDLATSKGATPSAVAVAWLLHHPAGILPIIGSPEPEHIIENCAADRVALSDDEWYRLFYTATALPPLFG